MISASYFQFIYEIHTPTQITFIVGIHMFTGLFFQFFCIFEIFHSKTLGGKHWEYCYMNFKNYDKNRSIQVITKKIQPVNSSSLTFF